MKSASALVLRDLTKRTILLIRGQKVILDIHPAGL